MEPLNCPPALELLPPSELKLNGFEPSPETKILKIIKESSKASCTLYPLPTTFLVDNFLPELLPVITDNSEIMLPAPPTAPGVAIRYMYRYTL